MVYKILAVDDEEPLRDLYKEILEDFLGCEVTTAGDAEEALKTLGEIRDFSLVLTDKTMPGMNGDQLIARIRENGYGLPDGLVPVILISTYELPDELKQFPHVHYLQKPARIEEIVAKVKEALGEPTS